MTQIGRKGPRDRHNLLEGKVEIWAYKKGVLFHHEVTKNILLYAGLAEVIRTICVTTPSTKPRIVTRMAVGDQGAIPSDSTVPKVPTKDLTGLFHEFYRKDVDSTTPTLYSTTGFAYTGNTTINSSVISGLSSIAGITAGMIVTGTGVPTGTVVTNPALSGNSIQVSQNATSTNAAVSIHFLGTTNQVQFEAVFNAVDVPLSSFSNPVKPLLNEVGLVIIDPTAPDGLVRAPVFAPTAPPADEVVLSLRTFTSVPFQASNDISVTVRYTLFTE